MKKAVSGGRTEVDDLGRALQTEVIPEKVVPVWGYKALDFFMGGEFSQ